MDVMCMHLSKETRRTLLEPLELNVVVTRCPTTHRFWELNSDSHRLNYLLSTDHYISDLAS